MRHRGYNRPIWLDERTDVQGGQTAKKYTGNAFVDTDKWWKYKNEPKIASENNVSFEIHARNNS